MRCFIAIDIEDTVRADMLDLQERLRREVDLRHDAVKWVHPEAFHLTLKFLGEITDTRIANLCQITETVAQRHSSFDLELNQLGHFGGRQARVLWLGSGTPNPPLLTLQQDLEKELDQHGWPRDGRPFSCHLTLCRIKSPSAGYQLAKIAKKTPDQDCGATYVDTLTVYQSELHKQGPLYTPLGYYSLYTPTD